MSGESCSVGGDGGATTETSASFSSSCATSKEEKITTEDKTYHSPGDKSTETTDGSGSANSNNRGETTATTEQQRGSGCSSATDNRSSSSSSTTTTTTTSTTSTSTSTSTRSRAGSSTTSMSKFKEKRPEPLKLNQANLANFINSNSNNNQETPLDLSVKSAGYVQTSGFLGIFNNLTAAATMTAAAATTTSSRHMNTALETPRIVWQDNDALLVKQRLFSSSTSANSQRLRLSSLAGDSPPITPGTPLMDVVVSSPSSMMVCSPISRTQQQQHQLNRHSFLSPLFGSPGHNHLSLKHHFPPTTKPLSASYALPPGSSQSLQSALMSAPQLQQCNKHLPEQQSFSSNEDSQHQYQAMLNAAAAAAAAKLNSPFNLELQSVPGTFEAYLRAPRRSCSTENLTSSLVATNRTPLMLALDHQHYNFLQSQQQKRGATIKPAPPGSRYSHPPNQQKLAEQFADESSSKEGHVLAATSSERTNHQQHTNNCFSYSGQQIAAAAAELRKSHSPIIDVIEGSPSSSNEDTRDSNSNPKKGPKALTPTSVANATANLLNIRLNSPSTTGQPQQQKVPSPVEQPMDDPLISAAYCREQGATSSSSSWSSANDIRSMNVPAATTTTSGGGCGPGSSLSSISTTLNTPTLISPSHFKGGSICFLPSPTLSPMSSVFELPSPLLMFPPPPITSTSTSTSTFTSTSTSTSTTTSAIDKTAVASGSRLFVQRETKIMSDPALSCHVVDGAPTADAKSKASSELALSEPNAQMQVDQQQFGSASEGNLAHLVTCARDKLGHRANNDNEDDEDDNNDGDNEADAGNDDESMDIDLQPQLVADEQTALKYRQQTEAIPRILVSDCLVQQQQQLAENGWLPSTPARHRQPISKRSMSPQPQRTHISVHQRERLESSSAPPDIFQGKARPKLKWVTGGSAADFHANYLHQPSAYVAAAGSANFSANQTRAQQQQQPSDNHHLAGNQYQSRQTVVAASLSNGHVAYQGYSSGRQLIAARPSSADAAPTHARSSTTLGRNTPDVDYLATNHREQPQHLASMAGGGAGSGLSHSAQHLQGYVAGTHHDDFLQAAARQQQQSMSASELHRSAQIHDQCSQISMGANQRTFQPTTTTTTTALMTSNQLMAGHHNQPFLLQQQQHQHQHQSRRVDAPTTCGTVAGMSDHSLSMGELDSLLHHQIMTTGANHSLGEQQLHHHQQQPSSAIQGQRAASACSLSLGNPCNPVTSSHHLNHNHHHQQPMQLQHNQQHHHHHHHQQQQQLLLQQQQQQQQLHHHQLEGFSGSAMVTPAPATSFRSNSVAGSTVDHQSHIVAAVAAAAADAKKYRCDECTKAFTRSDMLTRHKRLHSGDRPFQCNECKQEFSRSDHLSTHMRTHTGEKPYRCKLCSYSACRKDMITRHMKVHNRSSPSAAVGPNFVDQRNQTRPPS